MSVSTRSSAGNESDASRNERAGPAPDPRPRGEPALHAPILTGDLGATTMAEVRRLKGVRPYAIDPGEAERLWRLSEQLLGLDERRSRELRRS